MDILIDNYDSFTYILLHYLLMAGSDCKVYRNDEITVDELVRLHPRRLIISPGPETPVQAGITMGAIARFYDRIPILGVCLGHQALAMHFGAQLVKAPYPMHGKTSDISHYGHPLFQNIPSPFTAMRYHSLSVTGFEGTGLQPTAHSEDGVVMALAHERYQICGVQFHPESIGTSYGQQMLVNWL